MVGVDITSLDLPAIRKTVDLEDGTGEEVRQRNLQKLLRHGFSVKQANFIAEWSANNASFDLPSGVEREARSVYDNPFVNLSEQQMGELAVAGYGNSFREPVENRPIRNVIRTDRMSMDPNAPAFEGGAGGPVANSPHLPASPESPNENELAPKYRGYRGGNTPFVPPDGSPLGIVNPPPEMQERLLTVGETAELARQREEQDRPGSIDNQEAMAAVPADYESRPAYSPSNLPGTPETAKADVVETGHTSATEATQSDFLSLGNEGADAIEARERSENSIGQYQGTESQRPPTETSGGDSSGQSGQV